MNATRLSCSRLLAASIALAACAGDTAPPRKLTGSDVSPPVWGVLEVPSTPGPHAAVILIPGSAGWRPDYARFAKTFADSGFVALAIDYYAAAPRETSPADGNAKWLVWQATVRNAVAFVDALPSVTPNRIALVGYSRGAFLAVSVASSIPKVAAVVDFYGGGPAGSSDDKVWHFPPLLILHGDADKDVSVDLAHLLRNEVVAHGGTVEMHIYPGAKHAFNGPWAWAYSERDAADSWGRTIEFLRRQLAH